MVSRNASFCELIGGAGYLAYSKFPAVLGARFIENIHMSTQNPIYNVADIRPFWY